MLHFEHRSLIDGIKFDASTHRMISRRICKKRILALPHFLVRCNRFSAQQRGSEGRILEETFYSDQKSAFDDVRLGAERLKS